MKKILIGLITYVILFNFIFCFHAYAGEQPEDEYKYEGAAEALTKADGGSLSGTDLSDMLDSGQSGKTSSNQFDILEDKGLLGTAVGLFGFVLSVLPLFIELALSYLGGYLGSHQTNGYFTIEKVVFNQIGMFDADFLNYEDTYVAGDVTVTVPGYLKTAKEGVAKIYYIMRFIALGLSLATLVYIGIRMAISTVAEEESKYKKMFIGWMESVLLLFMLHYIIAAMFVLNRALLNVCWDFYTTLNQDSSTNFEENLLKSIFTGYTTISGVGVIYLTLSLWVLTYAHIKFFWLYMKRVFMTGFLIAVSPLIMITYPIDKAGDGKAQAFSGWLKELLVTTSIQPIHCIIYMVFNETAGEISKVAPLLALIFLVLITYAEKAVRKLFLSSESSAVIGGLNEGKEGFNKAIGSEGFIGHLMKLKKES